MLIRDSTGLRGCISGKQLQNLRTYLEDPAKPGTYRWDMLDGYEDGGKGGLDNAPDLQEKVRRVITQGFVDAEDWNGDAEMNVLGAVGTRSNETKKRLREEKKEADLNPPSELEEEAPPKVRVLPPFAPYYQKATVQLQPGKQDLQRLTRRDTLKIDLFRKGSRVKNIHN